MLPINNNRHCHHSPTNKSKYLYETMCQPYKLKDASVTNLYSIYTHHHLYNLNCIITTWHVYIIFYYQWNQRFQFKVPVRLPVNIKYSFCQKRPDVSPTGYVQSISFNNTSDI